MMPAFEFSDTDEIPKFHKLINCHMVFDIKLGNLACKAQFVAGDHQMDPPKDTTYPYLEGQHQDCFPSSCHLE